MSENKYLEISIFGPPAVGKSTALAEFGVAVSIGKVLRKVNLIDIEGFYSPDRDKLQQTVSIILKLRSGNLAVGADGADHNWFSGHKLLILPPSIEVYRKIFFQKAKRRGVGSHSWEEARSVYLAYSAMQKEFDQVVASSDLAVQHMIHMYNALSGGGM
jgi:hypothetical protein